MFLITYTVQLLPQRGQPRRGAQKRTGASLAAVAPTPIGPQSVALIRNVLVVVPAARLVAVALAPDLDGRDAGPEAAGAGVHAGTNAAARAFVAVLARALLAVSWAAVWKVNRR